MLRVYVELGKNKKIDDTQRIETWEQILKDEKQNSTNAMRHLLDIYGRLQQAARRK